MEVVQVMDTKEFRKCMWETFTYGFKVGLAGFVAMITLYLCGCPFGVDLSKTAFMVGFLPMMAAGVILMIMHHFGWGRKNGTS